MAEKYEHLEKLRKECDAKKLKFEQTKHQITRKENQIMIRWMHFTGIMAEALDAEIMQRLRQLEH